MILLKKKDDYFKYLQIMKLSLDSFLLDDGLNTFNSLNDFLPVATISLKLDPMNIFERNTPFSLK